jgi:hypothetical protein
MLFPILLIGIKSVIKLRRIKRAIFGKPPFFWVPVYLSIHVCPLSNIVSYAKNNFYRKGDIEMSEDKQSIKDVLKKLPLNYPVGALYVNGATVVVATFVNYSEGIVYFIGDACQVVAIDADSIDGIDFAAADAEVEEA